MAARRAADGAGLVRGLGVWDAALVTIGSVLGTGIFITTADMARALPHAGLILLAWVVGGLLTLAGALTYAELGVLFPRAGGQYHFLKEAYGPLWGFLFGWTCFLVIMMRRHRDPGGRLRRVPRVLPALLLDAARAVRAAARIRHLDRQRRTARGRAGDRRSSPP